MQDYVKAVSCWCAWKALKFICALNFIYTRLGCIISYWAKVCIYYLLNARLMSDHIPYGLKFSRILSGIENILSAHYL